MANPSRTAAAASANGPIQTGTLLDVEVAGVTPGGLPAITCVGLTRATASGVSAGAPVAVAEGEGVLVAVGVKAGV